MVGGKLSLSQGTTFSNNSAVGGNGGGPYAVPGSTLLRSTEVTAETVETAKAGACT